MRAKLQRAGGVSFAWIDDALGRDRAAPYAIDVLADRTEHRKFGDDTVGEEIPIIDDLVDGLVDEVGLDDVHAHVHEAVGVADVLDVGQGSGLEVVDADHAVAPRQQLVAEVGSEEARTAIMRLDNLNARDLQGMYMLSAYWDTLGWVYFEYWMPHGT